MLVVTSYQYNKEVQETGADRRTVKIFSAQLGQKSSGLDSFFHRICQHIENSSPRGVKLLDMLQFERDNQKCQITHSPGWDNQWWPLE